MKITPGIPVSSLGAFLFNVRDFGAVGNGVANDTTPIQTAINAASAVGGGIVFLPAGVYNVTATLLIQASGVSLVGVANMYFTDVGSYTNGSEIFWSGGVGGPIVKFAPIEGAAAQALKGNRVENLYIRGTSTATIGLQLIAVQGGRFSNVFILECTVADLDLNVATTLGENRGTFRNTFTGLFLRNVNGAGQSGIGIRMDGDQNGAPSANVNANNFENVSINYTNGQGILINNADSNRFFGCIMGRLGGGTGIGLELAGSNLSDGCVARANTFWAFEAGLGGVIARATALTFASRDNTVFEYSLENGAPLPTIEAGAGFDYHHNREVVAWTASANRGDNSVTLIYGSDALQQLFGTVLTANRTVTINNLGVNGKLIPAGARMRITRTGGGAFTLTVQDSTPTVIKILSLSQWVDVVMNAVGGWQISAFGAL